MSAAVQVNLRGIKWKQNITEGNGKQVGIILENYLKFSGGDYSLGSARKHVGGKHQLI